MDVIQEPRSVRKNPVSYTHLDVYKRQTLTSGTITIAVDETFRPIIEEELQVFYALTPDATVHPIYCSEVEAMKLLLRCV